MTRLVRVPLGQCPISGKSSFDLCVRFKQQIRSVVKSVDGAWLQTVDYPETHTRGVEVVYDAHTPGAREWSEEVAAIAPDLWQSLITRRKGLTR